jgi:tetratricopeptide (TPR) repeat protein
MTKGILGGIFGEEEEKPEVEESEATAGADAFAAAIAHHASIQNPEVARDASAFLRGQLHHVEVQTKHLEEEHGLRIAHLRNQLAEERVRRLALRLRVGFQLFVVLVATAIGLGLFVTVYDAFHSRNVVIDLFEVAPGLSPPIPNGKMVAASLLDRLTQLQAATRISAEKRGLSSAWTNEINIEVPETGLSIGQIERTLKARFGHDDHIDGDLMKTETGALALTVRGNRILPKTFTNNEGHLGRLVDVAAEYIYGESEPGLFAKYLSDTNRADEAIAFVRAHLASATIQEQPILLNYWGNAIGAKAAPNANTEALPLYREAVRIKPDYWVGYNNLMLDLFNLGDLDGLIRVGNQMMKIAGGRPGKASEDMYEVYDSVVNNLQAERAAGLADMEGTGGTLTAQAGAEGLIVAQIDVQLHEVDTARLHLKTTVWDEMSSPDAANAAFAQATLAEEVGDLTAAANAWDVYAKAFADPVVSVQNSSGICSAAITYEKTNQPNKADAALNAVGALSHPDCFRYKADLLDLRGDWAGAQVWYEKAIQLAPSYPASYYSWGIALGKHKDLKDAAEQFRLANLKGPHWADPLKAWGDVLVELGAPNEALAKYDEAFKYAPNWEQLKEARESIAKHKN